MLRVFLYMKVALLICCQIAFAQTEKNATWSQTSSPAITAETAPGRQDTADLNITNMSHRADALSLPKNILNDQKTFWTSPAHLRPNDATWLVPFLGITSGLIGGDTQIEKNLPKNTKLIKRSQTFSKFGVASYVGTAGSLYLWGQITSNERMRETGWLSGETVINSFLTSTILKAVAGRQRPLEGNSKGNFWESGTSFPSEHAGLAWSVASIVAHEYPGPLTKLLAYGSASAISAARVTGRNHFPSDVFVGSALGWYLGRQIYRSHHDPDLDGAEWGTFDRDDGESAHTPAVTGSPYVPLDSWVYPAFDRLAAMGYVQTAFAGIRPWTRSECARLLEESGERIEASATPEPEDIYQALREEFIQEVESPDEGHDAAIDSIYTRFMGISGKPLADGYHFGQTVINDYGRPYSEGTNISTGISAHAVAGPIVLYVRGEYQHAPSIPGYPLQVRQFIANIDDNPLQPAFSTGAISRFVALDSYAGMNIGNFEVTFGKQSLWWGPTAGGPLLFNNNAEPIYMLRISRVTPFTLPGILRYFGPIRTELFWGKLSGHQFPPQPWISGQKFSFKPSPNLEFGFSRTVMFGGVGHPLTSRAFYRSFFSAAPGNSNPRLDPGERFVAFDLNYRIPGLRKWLTLYTDSMVPDDPLPLGAPGRAALNSGIFLPRLPGIPKLDLRAEAVYTNDPAGGGRPGQFVYFKSEYHDGYTNKGNLLGSWIGRDGNGYQLWSAYSFTPQNTIQIAYRNAKVNPKFVPGGGTINDIGANANWKLRSNLSLTMTLQHERWRFPILSPRIERNIEFSFQLNVTPKFLTTH